MCAAGMSISHAASFPILAKPSLVSCAMSRLFPGISFAMIYASLFTKTNRIARILAGSKKRFPTRKPLFMSAMAQVRTFTISQQNIPTLLTSKCYNNNNLQKHNHV